MAGGGGGKSHHHISIPKAVASLGSALGSFAGHNDESAAVERTAKSPNAAGGRPAVNRRRGRQNHGNGIGQEEIEAERRTGC